MKELRSLLSYRKINLVSILSVLSLLCLGQNEVTVVDEKNIPLIGVEVFTDGFTFAEITDTEGHCSLPADLSEQTVINFKYLGYRTKSLNLKQIRDQGFLVKLSPGITLDEVTVVGRTNSKAEDLPQKVTSIDTRVFSLSNPQTAADALGKHSEVYIQKSQMGGGSPVIRGFEANKVLLVLDGIRLNNAIYRSGHLQNAITIDNAMLSSIEVIYGPGSLMYGSDALGGVVHFRSKSPKLNFSGDGALLSEGHFYTRFATANNEKSFHLDFNLGGPKFGSLSSISYSSFGDLRSGSNRPSSYPDFGKRNVYVERINNEDVIITNNDPDVQVGTAYNQLDALQKWVYRVSDDLSLSANIQFSTSSDIPRYDNLSEIEDNGDPAFAEWYYGPQKRLLSSIRADVYSENMLFDKAIIIGAYQQVSEDRISRKFSQTNREHNEEEVNIFSITGDFNRSFTSLFNTELNYGFEFNTNDVVSESYVENIITEERSDSIFSRYPSGGSGMSNAAAFFYLNVPLSGASRLFAGARFTTTNLNVRFLRTDLIEWPESFYEGLNSSNRAFTWSVGSNVKVLSQTKLQAMISTAFRSPNIDDLAKTRVQNDEVSVPNLQLVPEKSFNYELTLQQLFGEHGQISVTGFYTSLTDAIVRRNFALPDGTTFLVDDGDTLVTVANINAEKARVYGLSINGQSSIFDGLTVFASYNHIKGRAIDSNDVEQPLSHIPPVYGKIGLKMAYQNMLGTVMWQFNRDKPLSDYGGSEDNPELATPDGTYAWSVLNINVQLPLYRSLSLSLGIENLLDIHYRPFASGVSGAGRNFMVSVRGGF